MISCFDDENKKCNFISDMRKKSTAIFLSVFLLFQIVFLRWISLRVDVVENYYSTTFYPFISNILRFFLQLFSFSVGDVLYTLLGIYIIYSIYKTIRLKKIFKFESLLQFFAFLSILLLFFNLLWGFNYYRKPLVNHLKIEKTSFTTAELEDFTTKLIIDINKIHLKITQNDTVKVTIPYSKDSIYNLSVDGYIKMSTKYSFLRTPNLKVKNSLYSTPLSYMGFAGYLNPFTNEAQVNKHIPLVSLIVTSCHELAHQVGFAPEFEANMIGYLVAINHKDKYFRYAGNYMALRYTLNELFLADENLYDQYLLKLNKGILLNMEESQLFWEQYQNLMEPYFKHFYDLFLKSNAQKDGIKSYKRVVGLMINYQKNSK